MALVAARAVAAPRNRAAWTLTALALGCWLAGSLAAAFGLGDVAGVLCVAVLATAYLAPATLLRDRVRPFPCWSAVGSRRRPCSCGERGWR